jgi:hypothetical protein
MSSRADAAQTDENRCGNPICTGQSEERVQLRLADAAVAN